MRALDHLPDATRDRMTPVFLLAPMPNAKRLERSFERLNKAMGGRAWFLDLDRRYAPKTADAPAAVEYRKLLDSSDHYANWRDEVIKHESAMPALQLWGAKPEVSASRQADFFRSKGRPFCIRFTPDLSLKLLEVVLQELGREGSADFTVILDAEWTNDVVSVTRWFDAILAGPCKKLEAYTRIVTSFTTTRKSYTDIQDVVEVPFQNRRVLSELTRHHSNFRRLVYGDWGSTRPRDARGGGPAPDRIDLPLKEAWVLSRRANDEEEWSYSRAASELLLKYPVSLNERTLWGEKMILDTSSERAGGINSPEGNIAARVNVHLHQQAFFDDGAEGIDLDDALPEVF